MVLRSALLAVSLFASVSAHAAYTRANSAPVLVSTIFANEWGSPFVTFSGTINSACSGGVGLYLYDITVTTNPNTLLRQNKMAVLMTAKATDKRVVLDYFYDPGVSGWGACYIQGIQIVD